MITGIDPSYFNQLNLTEPFDFRFYANSNQLNGNTFNVEYQAKASYLSLSMPSYRMVITCEINHGLCSLTIGTKVDMELEVGGSGDVATLSSLYVESIKPSKDGLKADVVLVDEWHLLDGNKPLKSCLLYTQDTTESFTFNYNANTFITSYKIKTLKTISSGSSNNNVIWLPPKITINEALQRVSFANKRTICYKNNLANYDEIDLFGSEFIPFKSVNFLDYQVIDKADTNFTTNLSVKRFDYNSIDKSKGNDYGFCDLSIEYGSQPKRYKSDENYEVSFTDNSFKNYNMFSKKDFSGSETAGYVQYMEAYNDHIKYYASGNTERYSYEFIIMGQDVSIDTTSEYTYYEPNIHSFLQANAVRMALVKYFSYPSISIDKCRINPCIECMDSVITETNRIIVEEISWSYNGSFVGSLKGRMLPKLLPPVVISSIVSPFISQATIVLENQNDCACEIGTKEGDYVQHIDTIDAHSQQTIVVPVNDPDDLTLYGKFFVDDGGDFDLQSEYVIIAEV